MSSRERPHTPESQSTRDAYEAGETTLNLNNVSDADLDSVSFEDDEDAHGLSLQTLSGLTLITAGLVYLVTEISGWSASALLHPDTVLPWLLGTGVLLLGIGVLALRPSSHSLLQPLATVSDPSDSDRASPNREAPKRLMRSRTDRKLFGVCGGIATYLDVDPTLVRVGFVLGSVVFGPLILIYLGLAFAIPKEPKS